MLEYISRPNDVYTFVSQDATTLVPPFSCAYNNVANDARNLAIGDEDGTVHIVDTKRDDSHPERTVQIQAHQNAIFDLCWTSDDSKIVGFPYRWLMSPLQLLARFPKPVLLLAIDFRIGRPDGENTRCGDKEMPGCFLWPYRKHQECLQEIQR